MDDELLRQSEGYLDAIFGPGAGAKHSQFLEHIANDGLREALHRGHLVGKRPVGATSVEKLRAFYFQATGELDETVLAAGTCA